MEVDETLILVFPLDSESLFGILLTAWFITFWDGVQTIAFAFPFCSYFSYSFFLFKILVFLYFQDETQ